MFVGIFTNPKTHAKPTLKTRLGGIFCLVLILNSITLWAQPKPSNANEIDPNLTLAHVLFEKNEYAKAAVLFEDLVDVNPNDENTQQRYIQCLVKLGEQDKAIKWIKKKIKKSSQPLNWVINECWVNTTYPEGPDQPKHLSRASELLDLILDQLKPRAFEQMGNMHVYVANRFESLGLKDYAIRTLTSAEEILGEIPEISNELAMLYMETGNREKGLEKYTNMMLSGLPFETVRPVFESHVTDSADFVVMQRLLLKKIQEYPDVTALSEGLKWTFIKQENWSSAFLYTRSLDKRLKENGTRVYELGILCQSNKQYNVAIQCFEYCLNLKESCFDLPACQSALIDVTYEKTISSNPGTETLISLRNRMREFEKSYGPQEATLNNALKLAQLLVRYDSIFSHADIAKGNTAASPQTSNNSSCHEAEELLRKYLNEGSYMKKTSLAKIKMALGDVLVAGGDVWTSELLFAQVEKDFKEEETGQFAKFKRAELSFYRGDFDWASMQLDVLKSATTQLISNDAMELALVIIDNLGIDSNYQALKWYGQALLFEKQHQYNKSWAYLDSVVNTYPGHVLSDEVLYVKARIRKEQGQFAQAAELLETLSLAFNFDILADNALYQLGMLYAYQLNNQEKAMAAFEKLIEKYGSSVYLVDARREYRKIRGY
ncbi:MAG: tetratricopeptide repeat protein [Sphingomonadales bacterium]|nr:tetratricopeptide repeat protein [Sphingomonadales bacterium]